MDTVVKRGPWQPVVLWDEVTFLCVSKMIKNCPYIVMRRSKFAYAGRTVESILHDDLDLKKNYL